MRRPSISLTYSQILKPASRWFLALLVVAVFGAMSVGFDSHWISASSSGAALSGTIPISPSIVECGGGSQEFGFLSATGESIDSINLDDIGDSIDIQVCADGLTLGGAETVQVSITHDDSVIELIDPACAGLLDGGFASPSTKRTDDDLASAFICTKPGGVSGSSGALMKLTARRVGAGGGVFTFRTSGSLSTALYESGSLADVSGFDSLAYSQYNVLVTPTVIPTITPTVPPAAPPPVVFFPDPTATPVPVVAPSSGDAPPSLQLEPPTEPTSFEATAGILSVILTWGVPEDTSNRPVDVYMVQNLRTGEIVRVNGELLTYTFTDLDPELSYNFTIKASTGLGVGPATGVGPVTPLGEPEIAVIPSPTVGVAVTATVAVLPTATVIVEASPTSTVTSGAAAPVVIVVTEAERDAFERELEEILGSDVSFDEAELTTVSDIDGISVGIPVAGLDADADLTGSLDIQIGQLSLSVVDGAGDAELLISNDISVVGAAAVTAGDGVLDVQISEPVLQYSPLAVDDGSFAGSSNGISDIGVSFAVDLDVLPGEVGLSTTFSADPEELETAVGTTFALSGGDELAYFVSVEKSGITQDDLGNNVVTMNVSLAWLDAMTAAGKEIAITKVSDTGEVFTESAQCEQLATIAVCIVTFSGEAGGFSLFAIYGFVNPNPQPAPQPLATQVPVPTSSSNAVPSPTAEPNADAATDPTLDPSATPEIAPAPTIENAEQDQPITAGGGDSGGGPSLLVIVAIGVVVVVAGGGVASAYYRRPSVQGVGLLIVAVGVGSVVLLAGNVSVVSAGGVADVANPNVQDLDASHVPNFDKGDFRFRKVGSSIQALKEALTSGTLDVEGEIDPSIDVSMRFDSLESVNLGLVGQFGSVLNHVEDIVEVRVPIRIAHQLSYISGVVRVDEIVPPQVDVTSEGTGVHGSPAWNSVGIDGSGIKVGIIDVGFQNWSAISPSELPTPTGMRCYTSAGVFTSTLSDCEVDSIHGTAVAEAVDDIAPGIELYIANPYTRADLLATTQWMISEGVQIINHSVGWMWDGPGDGTSPYTTSPLKSVDEAAANDVLWVNAAGNSYGEVWFDDWSDADGDNYLAFSGTDELNSITVSSPTTLDIQMRWDDSWSNADIDIDLCIFDSTLLFENAYCSFSEQSGASGHIPFERVVASVPAGTYHVAVYRYAGAEPSWIEVKAWSGQSLEHIGEGRSIGNPASSANSGMLTVGAAPYTSTTTIEPFSSQGPTTDGRTKPDIVGADAATSAAYGSTWYGTSLASPHVAGLAALALQRFPSKSPAELATYLKTNAADRGAAGVDNVWGHGFAELTAPTAPSAVADSYSIDEDGVLAVSAPGVISNDSDDADSFSPQIVATPTHASVFSLDSSGSFTYEPEDDFSGSDSFTYKAVDSWQESSVVSVDLTINPMADVDGISTAQGVSNPNTVGVSVAGTGSSTGVTAFVAESNGAFTKQLSADTFAIVAEVDGYIDRSLTGQSVSTSDMSIGSTQLRAGDVDNDADVDSDDAVALLAAFIAGLPSAGSRDDGSGNTVDLNNDDIVDAIDISLWASNYSLQGPMAWDTVATTPPLGIADSYFVAEGNQLAVGVSGVLGNDFDEEGDSLSVMWVGSPEHGDLILYTDGSFTYDPDSGYTGTDSFLYYPSDDHLIGMPAIVTIDVRTSPGTTVGTTAGTTVGTTVGTTAGTTAGTTVGTTVGATPGPTAGPPPTPTPSPTSTPISAVFSTHQKLEASDGDWFDSFGRSVDIEGDTAVMGAPWDDDGGIASGSAYILTSNGGT